MQKPETIEQVQEFVREQDRVHVCGSGTKPALAAGANLSLAGLSGVLEYQPGEYTFTALAGTRVSEVQAMLAEHGQYLPFDPPFAHLVNAITGQPATALVFV